MLSDQLEQLLPAVLLELGGVDESLVVVAARVDEWYLRPHDYPEAVHQVIEAFCLWVVRRPHRVCADVRDECCVFVVVFTPQGVAHLGPVLMAAHALELQMAAVEEETFVGVYLEEAQPEWLAHHVGSRAIDEQRHLDGVDERVFAPVPKVRVAQCEAYLACRRPALRQADGSLLGQHLVIAVEQAQAQHGIACRVGGIGDIDDGTHAGKLMAHAVLHEAHTRRAVVERRDADGRGHDDMDIAVEPAVVVEVARERHHLERLAVVDAHQQGVVLAVGYLVGYLEDECPVAPLMVSRVLPVDENVGDGVGSLETEEYPLALPVERDGQLLFIVPDAAFVVGAAHQRVLRVPGVRQVHAARREPLDILREAELPVVVQ